MATRKTTTDVVRNAWALGWRVSVMLLGLLGTLVGLVWWQLNAAVNVGDAAAMDRVQAVEQRVERVEQRIDSRLDRIETLLLDRLPAKGP